MAKDLGHRWDGVHYYKPGAQLVWDTIIPELQALRVSVSTRSHAVSARPNAEGAVDGAAQTVPIESAVRRCRGRRRRRGCRRPGAGWRPRASARRPRGCRARPPARTGASSSVKQCSAAHAATSAPNPPVSTSSCTTSSRCVRGHADSATRSWSHGDDACAGRSTSTSMPVARPARLGRLQRLLDGGAPRHDREVVARAGARRPRRTGSRSRAGGNGSTVYGWRSRCLCSRNSTGSSQRNA